MFGLFKKPAPPMDEPDVRDLKIAIANEAGLFVRLADYPVVTRNAGQIWVACLVSRDGHEGVRAYGNCELNCLRALIEALSKHNGDVFLTRAESPMTVPG
jgi:hypothetical protein